VGASTDDNDDGGGDDDDDDDDDALVPLPPLPGVVDSVRRV
jgi:hypothetical protein